MRKLGEGVPGSGERSKRAHGMDADSHPEDGNREGGSMRYGLSGESSKDVSTWDDIWRSTREGMDGRFLY